jgi:hypothetical protein
MPKDFRGEIVLGECFRDSAHINGSATLERLSQFSPSLSGTFMLRSFRLMLSIGLQSQQEQFSQVPGQNFAVRRRPSRWRVRHPRL